jgi:hypothetical protein
MSRGHELGPRHWYQCLVVAVWVCVFKCLYWQTLIDLGKGKMLETNTKGQLWLVKARSIMQSVQ